MRILLSIKPEYSELIYAGVKLWEYRRTIWKNQEVEDGIIYTSKPIQLITGTFKIGRILHLPLSELLLRTGGDTGISKEKFYQYFGAIEKGYAIELLWVYRLKNPLPIFKTLNINPPQSWRYVWRNGRYLGLVTI